MKSCGTCTLCCTVMGVDMAPHPEPHKPIYTPCRHLCKKGCGIYDIRPTTCRDWQCLWLFTQTLDTTLNLPKELRPDRCGVVLEVNYEGNFIAHCRTGEEWRRDSMRRFLLNAVARGTQVLVGHHEYYGLLRKDGRLEELVRVGADDRGQIQYARKESIEAKIHEAGEKAA
jgi:hypothetical protein